MTAIASSQRRRWGHTSAALALSATLLAFAALGPAAAQSLVSVPARAPDLALHCIETADPNFTLTFRIWLAERICGFGDGSASYSCRIDEYSFVFTQPLNSGRQAQYRVDRVTGKMTVFADKSYTFQCSKVTPQTKKF